jgi:hypothetical protein
VHNVRSAILLSQPVVTRAGIENQRALVFQRIGERDHRLRAQVRNDERDAAFDMPFDLRNQFSDITVLNDLECEFLLKEPTGRVVVADGEPRTGNAVVRRRNIEK